jgi:hypothetical protein
VAQRRCTDDQAFAGFGHVLNIGGLSTGGLFCIAAKARADPSQLVVKEAEEQALVFVHILVLLVPDR